MCFGISDRSPVIKALIIAFVSELVKLIESMVSFVAAPHFVKYPIRLCVGGELIERMLADNPHNIPHEARQRPMMSLRRSGGDE